MFRGATHHDDWLARHWASRLLHRVGEIVADAGAGVVAALLALVWAIVGAAAGFPTWWATVLYSVTGVGHVRDGVRHPAHPDNARSLRLQRKLDELLRATELATTA